MDAVPFDTCLWKLLNKTAGVVYAVLQQTNSVFLLLDVRRVTWLRTQPGWTGPAYFMPGRTSGQLIPEWVWWLWTKTSSPSRSKMWTWRMKASTCARSRPAVDLRPPQCILSSKVTLNLTFIPLDDIEGTLSQTYAVLGGRFCFILSSNLISFIAPLGHLGTKCLAHGDGGGGCFSLTLLCEVNGK